MKLNSSFIEMLCVFCAGMLWGTTGTIQGLLPTILEPPVVAAFRVIIGATSLWIICIVTKIPLNAILELPLRRILGTGIAIASYNLFFFSSVAYAGVGVGTAITLGSGPFWVSVFEILFTARRPSSRGILGQLTAIVGLVILVAGDTQDQGSYRGYGLAALAGMAYGTYVYLTRGFRVEIHSALIAAATFSVSSIMLFPSLVLLPPVWIGLRSTALLLFLGLVSTGVAFLLFTFGLKRMAASTAVTLALAEPLTAWFLATVVLNEPVTISKIIGVGILVCGIRIVAGELRSSS